MKQKKWYKLDNAAKIYPPTTSVQRAHTFSLTVVLHEQVDSQVLNKAVLNILDRVPTFNVRLKKGVFWYYLEENNKPFYVTPEDAFFLRPFYPDENNGYLFRVMYKDNHITMVLYHALTDGTGASDVLKLLLNEYLGLLGNKMSSEGIKKINAPSTKSEVTDNFVDMYSKSNEKLPKVNPAFKTNGTPFDYDGCGIINYTLSVKELKVVTKNLNVTITTFLIAVFLKAIYVSQIKGRDVKNKLVTILVPVNMRNLYKSDTLRNFVLFVRVSYDFSTEFDFNKMLDECRKQMEDGLKLNILSKMVASNVKFEKNFFLKILPLFIKDLGIKIAYRYVGDNLQTCNLSNLGEFKVPNSVAKHIDNVYFTLEPNFSCKNSLSIVSFNDKINLSFARTYVENDIERQFLAELVNNNLAVTINSNYWEKKL